MLKSQQSQIDYHAVHQHLYGDVGPQSPEEVLFIPPMAHLGHSERHSQFSWRLQIIFYLANFKESIICEYSDSFCKGPAQING